MQSVDSAPWSGKQAFKTALSAALFVGCYLGIASRGIATPPEIIRLRLPAAKVPNWFPAGTPLRVLIPGQFETLLHAAKQGAIQARDPARPRLVRAHHHASWNAGLLTGGSELVAELVDTGAAALPLEPWTPTILDRPGEKPIVGSLASGQTVLWLEPPETFARNKKVSLDWELRARLDSAGRSFALGLPGDETSILTLELPVGWIPVGPEMERQGPLPSSRPGFQVWRYNGRPGLLNIEIFDTRSSHSQRDSAKTWVSGTTEIVTVSSIDTDPRSANWKADWSVQIDPRGARQFTAELDAGLELLDVTGPEVKEFQKQREGERTRVKVVLTRQTRSPTPVRFEAHAKIPLEGRWSVPAIRPLDAVWTGGATTVMLDSLRVIQDCQERAGRRLPMQETGNRNATVLHFEASSPGPVADLMFRHPHIEAPCLVRGRLIVGTSAPELECRLSGPGISARASELEVELPPTWVANRVQWVGREESLSWHSAVLADGSTRLRVLVSGSEAATTSKSLLIGATSTTGGGRGPLLLPRVRPLHLPVSDETWVALVDPSMRLTPLSGHGLVWLVPDRVTGSPATKQSVADGPQIDLAWRWNDENAEARVDREGLDAEPRVEIRCHARITEDAQQLVLEGEILLDHGTRPLNALPIWIGEAASNHGNWSFRAAGEINDLAATSLNEAARARWGFPSSGSALSLPVRSSSSSWSRIRFTARQSWKSHGSIPLIMSARQFLPRGTVLVEIPRRMRSQIQSAGLRRLDHAVADRLASTWLRDDAPLASGRKTGHASFPIAHAFTYTELGGQLDLTTEELLQGPGTGIIRDARLTTVIHHTGPCLNRLRLLVHGELVSQLRFTMPRDAALVRVLLDGSEISPAIDQDSLVVNLPPGGTGTRLETLELDYEVQTVAIHAGGVIRPVLPSSGMPCLSFSWELLTPPRWEIDSQSAQLASCDPSPLPDWPLATLGVSWTHWPGRPPASPQASEETLRRLDEILSGTASEELTFAEWFTRWDSGAVPILIDRVALCAAELGPRSRCSPIRVDPAGQSVSLRTLQQYGLSLVSLDGSLVVTSQTEAANRGLFQSWRSMTNEAILWESDRTDRLQTASRWRGEVSPREALPGTPAQALRALPGWSVRRFTAASWPDQTTAVVLRVRGAGLALGWTTALLVLLGLNLWRLSPRGSVIVPIGLLALAVVLHLWVSDQHAAWTAGAFCGALVVLLYRLGKQLVLRPRHVGSPSQRTVEPAVRMVRSLARSAPLFLIVLLAPIEQAQARREAVGPIPVLLPYEGTFNPDARPVQVVLRESDYQRLSALARSHPAVETSQMILLDATHRLSWSGEQDIVLQSELTVRKPGREPATWKVPVSGAREISATLDGTVVPVFLEDGGRQAAVPVEGGAGLFKVRFRSTATITREGPLRSLRLPVNALASARLIVEGKNHPRGLHLVSVRGTEKVEADQSISAQLGPADQIEIRWGDVHDQSSQLVGANLEGVILWDIEPAGDLLRARFTPRGPRGTSLLRFQMDPGLILRSVQIPGLVAGAWSGTEQEPVWTARMDPPLQVGSTIELDLWRPIDAGQSNTAEHNPEGRLSPPPVRRLPRLQPLQVERYSGVLGVRRPSNWTGRLEPVFGAEPLSDESFVKTWGPLPDDRLTLSGTTRLGRGDLPQLQTGPALTHIRSQGNLELQIDRGRIGVEYQAEVGDLGEPVHRMEIAIPGNLVVLRVDSPGLSDWSRKDPRQLLLRYDHVPLRSRQKVSVSGWIPIVEDPLESSNPVRRLPTPWLDIPGRENANDTLSISSTTPFDLIDARGLTLLPTPPATVSNALPPVLRKMYRVENAARLGSLQWSTPQPEVNVRVENQMIVHPDSAEWVAVVRYEIQGGALDSIHLKLSTPWALKAHYELTGNAFHLRSDSFGAVTLWTLRPDHPIWGSQRIVIRSALPLKPNQEVQQPEITPLGKGHAATYMGLVNATGTAITTAGSRGLQEIAPGSFFQSREFVHLPETETHVYRVGGDNIGSDNWSLKAQLPPATDSPQASGNESVGVVSADIDLTVRPDRSTQGRAVYQTEERTGRLLIIDLPPPCRLIWSTVDQIPVTPLRSPAGRWLIPLDEQGSHRACLFWTRPGDATPTAQEWSLPLPKAGVDHIPTLLTARLQGDLTLNSSQGELELTTADRVELERADRIAHQITDFMARMDRSSGRDRQRVTSLLIAHELTLRSAERSLRNNAGRGDPARRQRLERDIEFIRSSRQVVLDAVRASALDDEIDAAQYALGLAPATPAATTGSPAATAVPDRIRSLGEPTYLIGFTTGLSEQPTMISGSTRTPRVDAAETEPRARALLLLGVLIALGLLASSRSQRGLWNLVVLLTLLALLQFLGGPIIVATGIAIAAAGWLSQSPSQNPGPVHSALATPSSPSVFT